MHSCLSMNLFATFAFLLPGHATLSTTFDYLKQRKKTAEKIDTNAQWFHCSWSILLKRVNIRVRGFHLVDIEMSIYTCSTSKTHISLIIFGEKVIARECTNKKKYTYLILSYVNDIQKKCHP